MTVLLMALLACLDSSYPATEAVVTAGGEVVAMSNAAIAHRGSFILHVPVQGEIERPTRLRSVAGDQVKRTGPVSWGIVDGAHYSVGFSEAFGLALSCYSVPLEDRITMDRNVLPENRELHYAARRRVDAHASEHSRHLEVLFGVIQDLRRSGLPREAHSLFFDLAYTAPNHVMLIVVREGRLRWWTWNKPEETDWVDRGEMEARLEGAFRIVQAADDLYLVDSRGWVFSSPDRGARLLGTIAGWGQPREGETLFLLEEQKHGKIAVVKVAEGETTVLEAMVEAEAREDFMAVIDDEELDRAIIRMAAALREEEGGGK